MNEMVCQNRDEKMTGNSISNLITHTQNRMEYEGEVIRTDLYQFLRKWLLDHILDEDMKYGDYLKDA